jgi:hypothetical protein
MKTVGIDVSKLSLDIRYLNNQTTQFSHTNSQIKWRNTHSKFEWRVLVCILSGTPRGVSPTVIR